MIKYVPGVLMIPWFLCPTLGLDIMEFVNLCSSLFDSCGVGDLCKIHVTLADSVILSNIVIG